MSADGNSYRQILRSTSIIGGASVINILIGLVRVKVAAVLLGPAGIGLMGLFSNLISTASTVAALGTGTVGTRQIAEAAGRNDQQAVAVSRRALVWCTLMLATFGSVVFWLLRGTLATHVLNDPSLSGEVGWLALGVGLGVAGGSQSALLNGLRRIGDLARVSVYSAALATIIGVGVLLIWHQEGLIVYLLLTPLSSFMVGHWYVSHLPRIDAVPTQWRALTQQWVSLARVGTSFMLAGLALTVGQLLVRTLVQRELGADALGQFEAAWVVSMTYIGFVLRSMGTDFYPRLAAVIHNPSEVNRMINEQTEVALMLAGPVFLIMLGLAPWVIELMYSSKFTASATILRWQILGDLLKVVSWPLGFILLAAGDGRRFLFSDSFGVGVFVLCVWLGLPYLGLQATGVGFLMMYSVYLPVVYWMAKKRSGFAWSRTVRRLLWLLGGACGFTAAISLRYPLAAGGCGILFSILFVFNAITRLRESVPIIAAIDKKIQRLRQLIGMGI